MSYPVYGRYQAPEPPNALAELHVHKGGELKTASHVSPLAILDQSDLLEQGIHCSKFVPGCHVDPDALGSCTSEATQGWAAWGLTEVEWLTFCHRLVNGDPEHAPTSLADAVGAQRAAISFYHACTAQTGDPSTEWPPTDCGSSGVYVVSELERLDVIGGAKIAHDPTSLCSLLQSGPVLVGSPFLLAWEQPDNPSAIVDGDGSASNLEAQIRLGVAGGHETLIETIEAITVTPSGVVDPFTTILGVRNSWSKSWGDEGHFRIHLSTLAMLGQYVDYRQPYIHP